MFWTRRISSLFLIATLLLSGSFLLIQNQLDLAPQANAAASFAAAVDYTAGTSTRQVFSHDFDKDGDFDIAAANAGSNNVSIFLNAGTGIFAAAVNYSAGSAPGAIWGADLDLDGDIDLVTANSSGNNISVLLNNGNGTFAAAVDYSAGTNPAALAMGDFDKDGDVDIAVANYNSNNVSIFLNNGNGTFAAAVNYSADTGTTGVFAADFDGDGDVDIAASNYSSSNVSILLNNGNGTFAAAVNYAVAGGVAGGGAVSVSGADLEKDGDIDIVSANHDGHNLSVLLNNGNGTFAAAVNYNSGGLNPYHLSIADLDNDGDFDLSAANLNGNNISILLNNGSAVFGGATNYNVGTTPRGQYIADFDRDGDLDLVAANNTSGTVSVLINTGANSVPGTFDAAVNYAVGTNPQSVYGADFNNDGKIDMATANNSSNNVSVLLNNGTGTFAAVVNHAAGTNPQSVYGADFNNDGKIDMATANSISNNVSVLLNNGSGTFAAAVNYSVGSSLYSVYGADFNNDGKIDLVLTNGNGNNVSVLLNNGNGTFAAAVNYSVGSSPYSVYGADFNNDGKIDLATANPAVANVSVLLNNGNGTFAAANVVVTPGPYSVYGADFNNDGKVDLASANGNSNNVSVLMNAGNGPLTLPSFTPASNTLNVATTSNIVLNFSRDMNAATANTTNIPVSGSQSGLIAGVYSVVGGTVTFNPTNNFKDGEKIQFTVTTSVQASDGPGLANAAVSEFTVAVGGGYANFGPVGRTDYPVGAGPYSVYKGDFDGDNDLDLVIANFSGNNVSVLLGNGNGTFQAAVNYSVGSNPYSIYVGDFDGDNDLDLVTSNPNTNNVSVLLGNGNGTFQAVVGYSVGNIPRSIYAGDFDGDNDFDLVTANYGDNNVSVLLGNGNGTFQASVNYSVGSNPWSVYAGDFDGDNDLDLVTANGSSNNVSVLFGSGNGTFQAAVNYSVGQSPFGVHAGDFDGDNDLDLVAANYGGNNVSLLLGNGNGTFGAAVNYSVGLSPYSVYAGDFDGDNDLDIVTARFNSNTVSVLLGNGNGTFGVAVNYTVGSNPQSVYAGDFDGDNDLDLVAANQITNNVSVLLGNGNGTFQAAVNYSVGSYPHSVFAGDFDGDNDLDLVAANMLSNNVSVLLGNGNGTFQAAVNYGVGNSTASVFAGDFDGDNDLDLAAANYSGSTVSVLLGNGNGTFAAAVNYSVGPGPYGVFAGDFDGDNDLDLVAANVNGNNVSVLLGNGNGTFGTAVNYSVGGSTRSVYAGDFDGDNDLDLVAANALSNNVSMLLGNGNGTFQAAVNYSVGDSPRSVYAGDFDGDNDLDLVAANYGSNNVSLLFNIFPNAQPTAPTTLYTDSVDAQAGFTNPTGISSSTPVFSAICNDPDVGDILNKYRVQVDNNNDFSSVVWDSGAAGTSMANCTAGARSANITFGGTPLAFDGGLYYWRIKFWDDESPSGTSGRLSEIISTNTFTMQTAGTSQQVLIGRMIPNSPTALTGQALSTNSIHWSFLDNSANETGFKLVDAVGTILLQQELAGITSITESGLFANTQYAGRQVIAYNANGDSEASAEFAAVTTLAPTVTPKLISQTQTSVKVGINETFPNFEQGQSGLLFELVYTQASAAAEQIVSSGWIRALNYTFLDLAPGSTFQVRVKSRNQAGVETTASPLSAPITLNDREEPIMGFTFIVTQSNGSPLTAQPLDPHETLRARMTVSNTGSEAATNVLANLVLPPYIVYNSDSLAVNAAAQGTVFIASQNAASAYWVTMEPGESFVVTFQLGFDAAALRQLLAAANPEITLQATLSYDQSETTMYSEPVVVTPDLALLETITEEPVLAPTEDTVETIEAIIPNIIGTPEPIASEQVPVETITSYDADTFNLRVTSGENSLGLTGSAQVYADSIRFSGTTTEPFTTVTLIINGNVTVIVESDANGNWVTYVSAEQLGVQPGEELPVTVEAIAAKGELISDRVTVGNVLIFSGRGGELEAKFTTIVSASEFVTVVKEMQKQVVKVISEQEPTIQTTLSVAAPVVIISSVPLWGYLPYAPTMIYHFIMYPLGFIGRKKRFAARFYGVAYDSITKLPLPLAIVRIYFVSTPLAPPTSYVIPAEAGIPFSQRKLVSTVVTDKLGRYETLLASGQYTLEVAKPGYMFPSQIVTSELDADYQHVYSSNKGIQVEGETITIPDLPLDPINAQSQWKLAGGAKKVWYALQKVGNYLAVPILLIGAMLSVLVVATIPDQLINWLIAIFYIVLLSLQLKLRQKAEKAWGVIYDIASNAVLPLTAVQLIEAESSKVVSSRLTDYQGRFAFLPDPGQYVLKATRPGYQQVSEVVEAPSAGRQPLQAQIDIAKPNQRISGDVAMRAQ